MAQVPQGVQIKPCPEQVEPLSWLIGTWRCQDQGQGSFPTIQGFKYGEEMTFSNVGQPMLNYTSCTWHPELKFPMHQETGFLRIKPGTGQVCFLLSHNFGLTSTEEGTVENKSLRLKSVNISRMSFAKEPAVTELQRTIEMVDESTLHQVVLMATTKTPLTRHLEATYKKVTDE